MASMTAKQAQIIICCILYPDISTLVLSVQRTLFQKCRGLFSCNFANLSSATKRSLPGNPSK